LRTGDATQIDMKDNSFDVVTIAFGVRNVSDVGLALSEMYRCLKVKGRLIVLEFSLPTNRLIRALYLLYFRYWLPLFGGMISGDKSAYRYLNQTAENFPYGEAFMKRIRQTGFKNVSAHVLTFGVVTVYVADKDVM
jgi:demethylmenaquinone methyltransferase / 2-methoxy-6-polyprenyl-1,4-benzoquinol methylase